MAFTGRGYLNTECPHWPLFPYSFPLKIGIPRSVFLFAGCTYSHAVLVKSPGFKCLLCWCLLKLTSLRKAPPLNASLVYLTAYLTFPLGYLKDISNRHVPSILPSLPCLSDSNTILLASQPESLGLTDLPADMSLCWLVNIHLVEIWASFQNAYWAAHLLQQQLSLSKNRSESEIQMPSELGK